MIVNFGVLSFACCLLLLVDIHYISAETGNQTGGFSTLMQKIELLKIVRVKPLQNNNNNNNNGGDRIYHHSFNNNNNNNGGGRMHDHSFNNNNNNGGDTDYDYTFNNNNGNTGCIIFNHEQGRGCG